MTKTPEGLIKDRVKKLLKERGCYFLMPIQNGMGSPALDFHCIYRGMAFCIETKAGNKQPTERQKLTIQSIESAGGKCFVVNEETGTRELEKWFSDVDYNEDHYLIV